MDRKVPIIVGIVAIVFVIAIIGAAFMLRPAPEEEYSEEATEQVFEEGTSEEENVQEEPLEEGWPELTAEQQSLIQAYSDKEKDLTALLAANTWTASKETSTIDFTEDSYREIKDGKIANGGVRRFAICALDTDTSVESGVNGERAQTDATIMSVLLDDGTYVVMHLLAMTSTSSELPEMTINSSSFVDAKSYMRMRAAQGLSVEGLNEQALALMGGKQPQLTELLTEWCAINYPTASVATWDGRLDVNYNTNILSTSFTLNNQASSRVSIIYDMAYAAFSVDTKAGA